MNTALSPVSLQPELFQLTVMAQHGFLLPATSGLTPYAQRTIRRAINLLDKYLRQPGMSFTLGSYGYVYIAVYPTQR